ncbi:MAG: hypothetical protein EA361_02165 [Bacteroidetes bacterium]|nr:MAG: hypothetical protein EA361_02165 [Bacteroidota bacterium]
MARLKDYTLNSITPFSLKGCYTKARGTAPGKWPLSIHQAEGLTHNNLFLTHQSKYFIYCSRKTFFDC